MPYVPKTTGFEDLNPNGEDLRFHCASLERPKRKGKLLKRTLEERGHILHLTRCYDLIAQMYGYRNYAELREYVGYFGRSLSDEDVDEVTFGRRINFQVNKLLEIGVAPIEAEEIIELVRPTGKHASFARAIRPLGPVK
jgi:hypothetical protein